MGNFDKEKIPLKKMARQGQLFSGTKLIDELRAEEIERIEDIKILDEVTKEELYCFTDGIGNISPELANLIDRKYLLVKCSAYQVRMGGIKGVLMVDMNL